MSAVGAKRLVLQRPVTAWVYTILKCFDLPAGKYQQAAECKYDAYDFADAADLYRHKCEAQYKRRAAHCYELAGRWEDAAHT